MELGIFYSTPNKVMRVEWEEHFFICFFPSYNREYPRQGAFPSWSAIQQCDQVCWTALSSPGGRTRLNRSALNPAHYEMAPVKAPGSIISSWGISFRDVSKEIPLCVSPLPFAAPLSSCLLPACPAIYTTASPEPPLICDLRAHLEGEGRSFAWSKQEGPKKQYIIGLILSLGRSHPPSPHLLAFYMKYVLLPI